TPCEKEEKRAEAREQCEDGEARDSRRSLVRRAPRSGLAPAAVVAQHRDKRGEGLHQQRRLQRQAAAGGDRSAAAISGAVAVLHTCTVRDLLQTWRALKPRPKPQSSSSTTTRASSSC